MPSEYTLIEGLNPVGQAKLIVKGFGLGLIKPKFYSVGGSLNQRTLEELAREEGHDKDTNSFFGLPIFDVLEFDVLDYVDLDGKKYHLGGLTFGTALLDVTSGI
jgi:hypothetical protein